MRVVCSEHALLACPDAVPDHWRGVRASAVVTARCAMLNPTTDDKTSYELDDDVPVAGGDVP
jgi:hypothetical protein